MLKILVIDEDYRARYAISRILGDNGYEVLTAADDARGLYLLDRESPDIVIIDIVMTPETDGIETVSKMRDRCPQTRIVGLSGVSVAGILDPMQAAITARRARPDLQAARSDRSIALRRTIACAFGRSPAFLSRLGFSSRRCCGTVEPGCRSAA